MSSTESSAQLLQLVRLEIEPPVAIITLARPARHNSLIPDLLEDLLVALDTVRGRQDLRAIVLKAEGRSFSTGGDLKGFADHLGDIETYAGRVVGLLNRTILAMLSQPLPIVCAVQGAVTGGSLGLVLASDVVFAAPEAFFAPYYAAVGFSPDGGWTALLPDVIGQGRARSTLVADKKIPAETALEWGLVSRIVPAADLHAEARLLARALAGLQPGSLQGIKRLLMEKLGDVERRLEAERVLFVDTIGFPETQTAMIAFLDSLTHRRKGPEDH